MIGLTEDYGKYKGMMYEIIVDGGAGQYFQGLSKYKYKCSLLQSKQIQWTENIWRKFLPRKKVWHLNITNLLLQFVYTRLLVINEFTYNRSLEHETKLKNRTSQDKSDKGVDNMIIATLIPKITTDKLLSTFLFKHMNKASATNNWS